MSRPATFCAIWLLPVGYELQFHQPGKERNMVHPFGRALAGQPVASPQHGRQLQGLQVMSQKKIGGLGYAPSPDTRHM